MPLAYFSVHSLCQIVGACLTRFAGSLGWLITDVSIQCGSEEHTTVKQLAWSAVFMYPVGLLILNAALLLKARRTIVSGRTTPLSHALKFLYKEFEPQVHDTNIRAPCLTCFTLVQSATLTHIWCGLVVILSGRECAVTPAAGAQRLIGVVGARGR